MTTSYLEITVVPHEHEFGAKITGVDLAKPLTSQALAEIKKAWTRHSVVYFPNQELDHDQLETFTQQIGPFGINPFIEALDDHPNILEVRRSADEKAGNFGASWHSDWSFQKAPPSATILHSKVVPPIGGDTYYSDCYRAYETLSDVMKSMLAGRYALHSAGKPYGSKGFFAKESTPRAMKINPSADADKTQRQPLVRRHPESGRDLLYINGNYTVQIEGMQFEESKAILGYLYEHMVKDEFVYKHKWQPNMLTMWDNRCVLHSAQGGYDGHERVMHRTVVAGEEPQLADAAA